MKKIYVTMASLVWFCIGFQGVTGQTRADEADRVFVSDFEARLFSDSSELHRPGNLLSLWLASDPQMTADKQTALQGSLDRFCEDLRLRHPRYKSETDFLWFVFHKVHTEFLDYYRTNPPFYQVFSRKHQYNCVSGTALYSLILQRLDFQTQVKETRDHVYLLVQNKETPVLIESTDPTHGFITGKRIIEKRESEYAAKGIAREISLTNLCGLQYYNQAVELYFAGTYFQSQQLLDKAKKLYPDSGKIWHLSRKIQKLQLARLTAHNH